MPKVLRRKFYEIGPDFRAGGRPGFVLENIDTLAPSVGVLGPPAAGRGFPEYPEPPRFVFDRKLGRLPRDLELYHHYWLVSDRTKAVFQAVDRSGFLFIRCDVKLPQGNYEGPDYWLCDDIRVIDAVDEEKSRIAIGIGQDPKHLDFGQKYYSLLGVGGAKLVFRDDVIGDAHVF